MFLAASLTYLEKPWLARLINQVNLWYFSDCKTVRFQDGGQKLIFAGKPGRYSKHQCVLSQNKCS